MRRWVDLRIGAIPADLKRRSRIRVRFYWARLSPACLRTRGSTPAARHAS